MYIELVIQCTISKQVVKRIYDKPGNPNNIQLPRAHELEHVRDSEYLRHRPPAAANEPHRLPFLPRHYDY